MPNEKKKPKRQYNSSRKQIERLQTANLKLEDENISLTAKNAKLKKTVQMLLEI